MGNREKSSGHHILWAPWRLEYIQNASKNEGCIFCDKFKEEDDRSNLIVYRGETAYVIMNKYPYNNGHLLIVPCQHTAEIAALKNNEKIELFDLIQHSQEILIRVMKPQGFNVGMNLGRLAGAGITEHLHFHIVPRWGGDTNFMPVLGNTKVISESLDKTWEKLNNAFARDS